MIGRLRVISLDRTPERFANFLNTNPQIAVERFADIDGQTIDRAACVRDNLITADNTYRPGAIGHTLSNVTLWRQCRGSFMRPRRLGRCPVDA
jgi:glycosyl transferase family 25